MFIPFGEWAPDSPALIGAARQATNCIGEKDYYRPFPSVGVDTNALDTRVCGAISFTDKTGVIYNFAGDTSKLYKLSAAIYSNVSKAGNYTPLTDGRWEFAKFGTNVIATNYLNNVQAYNTASSTLFDDLAGNPPRAKHIAVVGEFVVLGNLVDGVFGVAANAVRWCGINNVTTWTPSAATQSDGQMLENGDGGAVQAIIGNSNYGIIIQERCIQRMNYIGSPLVFSFEVLERNRGTQLPNSVAGVGREVFYIADDGFYRFNGVQSIPIGKDKVNKWFWDNFDLTYKSRMSTSIDPINTIVMWAFASVGATTGGRPDTILCYNWISGRFTVIKTDIEIIYQALTPGFTLEELDNISITLEGLPFSLDADAWKGGKLLSGVFNDDNKAGYFQGQPMEAIIETTEFEGAKGRFSEISQCTPMIEGNSEMDITIRMGARNNRQADVSYYEAGGLDDLGCSKFRQNARYHQVEATISGGFDKATGIEIDEEFIKIGALR